MAFFMMQLADKNIFISPLDWGLGHTTRCIPIIKAIQALEGHVWLGVNKVQRKLLEQEVENVTYLDFEGYNISYPDNKGMALKISIQIPKILFRINQEKKQLDKLIRKHDFDLVISDNRFGLVSDLIPSIYITHQINIQAPLGIDKTLHKLHKNYIDKFTQCWIPDYEETTKSLAGRLSHGNLQEKYYFIDPISRFTVPALSSATEYEYLAILSGPEPQRTIFENSITKLFKSKQVKCAILGGKPLENNKTSNGLIDYFSHLTTNQFYNLTNVSKNIICRPGYSSIMDLSTLQKPVMFVPTPGQTEQEYLAKYYKANYDISFLRQEKLTLNNVAFNPLPYSANNNLKGRIEKIVSKIKE